MTSVCDEYGLFTVVPFLYISSVGGKEKFFHCDTCGFCLANSMRDTHLCRKEASKANCPICMEVQRGVEGSGGGRGWDCSGCRL